MYYASVTIHILAAILWLGGMLFLAVVGAPVLRKVEPPALRAQLFRQLGRAFRTVGWVAIAVLVLTGVANLAYKGWLTEAGLGSAAFWRSGSGWWLSVKLACVVSMIAFAAVHDFVLGPRAGRVEHGTPAALRLATWTSWVARINVLLGVILVIAAVRVVRGG